MSFDGMPAYWPPGVTFSLTDTMCSASDIRSMVWEWISFWLCDSMAAISFPSSVIMTKADGTHLSSCRMVRTISPAT